MTKLEDALEEHWPPERIVVTCRECEVELYDTRKDTPLIERPVFISDVINTLALSHEEETGHSSIDIELDTVQTEPVREIDCEITVN